MPRPADGWLFSFTFMDGCGRLWLWFNGCGAGWLWKSPAVKTSTVGLMKLETNAKHVHISRIETHRAYACLQPKANLKL